MWTAHSHSYGASAKSAFSFGTLIPMRHIWRIRHICRIGMSVPNEKALSLIHMRHLFICQLRLSDDIFFDVCTYVSVYIFHSHEAIIYMRHSWRIRHECLMFLNLCHEYLMSTNLRHECLMSMNLLHNYLMSMNLRHECLMPMNLLHDYLMSMNLLHEYPMSMNPRHECLISTNLRRDYLMSMNSLHEYLMSIHLRHEYLMSMNLRHDYLMSMNLYHE